MEGTTVKLTRDEFYKQYGPQKNHLDKDADWDGVLYEIFGKEAEYCRFKSLENKVWSIIECDNYDPDEDMLEMLEAEMDYLDEKFQSEPVCLLIVSGYHVTDAIGYIVTYKPYEEGVEIEVKIEI